MSTPFVRPDLVDFIAYEAKAIPHKIKMDANESPFDLPYSIKRALAEDLVSLPLNRYPDASGSKLKNRLAQLLGVTLEQIAVGNGSDELINHIILAFGGDYSRVIFPKPTFVMYEIIAKVCGVEAKAIDLDQNFDISAKTLIENFTTRGVNLLFFSYPNNPTANCFSETEIIKVIETKRAIVVIDEAYFEFSKKSLLPLLKSKSYDNLIILRTFSKAFSLAALRVGYAVSSPQLIAQIEKVRLPYNVNAFSQLAAIKLLENLPIIAEQTELILKERDRIVKELSSIANIDGIILYKSDANFILFRVANPEEVYQKLLKNGILIKNLNRSGILKGCLRVTVGKPKENEAFIATLKGEGQWAMGNGQL